MTRKWFSTLFALTLFLMIIGCTPAPSTNPVTGNDTIPTQTPEAPQIVAHPTLPPQPVETPTIAPTPAPQVIEGEVSAATLNMRAGPSMLHNIISQYQKGEVVSVLARAPGNEWVKVLTKDNKTGWMYAVHLVFRQNLDLVPVVPINESLVVKGKVVDASGNGIPGIQVAVTRVGGAQRVRVDGKSLSDGTFFAYAPVEYQGTWLASVIGVDCKSPIVDTNCRYAGVFEPTAGINLTLPMKDDIVFTYK